MSPSNRLRFVLRSNAAFSATSGVVALVAAPWVSTELGIDHELITRLLGLGLILFAAGVAHTSHLPEPALTREAALVSLADISWVVGTVVVIATGILTTSGVIVAAVVGSIVADFGAGQLWYRRRVVGRDHTATLAV